MDTKRFTALEEIVSTVQKDLEKVPIRCQDSMSYRQQRDFFYWLITLTSCCHPMNITNYPLRYRKRIDLCPFLVENSKRWKYLIEFNDV
jgi:hypothetical protein